MKVIQNEMPESRLLWEGHASLAAVYDNLQRQSEAREQWGAAAQLIHMAANGLSDRTLREGFLEAKPIRDILRHIGIK